jgi:hypothetical protein
MNWIYHTVRYALAHYGYWAVLGGLLGENMGVPLPGETVLMFASFLAHKTNGLNLTWVVRVGTQRQVGATTWRSQTGIASHLRENSQPECRGALSTRNVGVIHSTESVAIVSESLFNTHFTTRGCHGPTVVYTRHSGNDAKRQDK